MMRDESAERGMEIRLAALDRLIADQEAYLARLRLQQARMQKDLRLIKSGKVAA